MLSSVYTYKETKMFKQLHQFTKNFNSEDPLEDVEDSDRDLFDRTNKLISAYLKDKHFKNISEIVKQSKDGLSWTESTPPKPEWQCITRQMLYDWFGNSLEFKVFNNIYDDGTDYLSILSKNTVCINVDDTTPSDSPEDVIDLTNTQPGPMSQKPVDSIDLTRPKMKPKPSSSLFDKTV